MVLKTIYTSLLLKEKLNYLYNKHSSRLPRMVKNYK
nr:MAG TPA: hypothetical protein [Herelleviridae sp.]